jgi:ABC-type methionine transport system permease subunit
MVTLPPHAVALIRAPRTLVARRYLVSIACVVIAILLSFILLLLALAPASRRIAPPSGGVSGGLACVIRGSACAYQVHCTLP